MCLTFNKQNENHCRLMRSRPNGQASVPIGVLRQEEWILFARWLFYFFFRKCGIHQKRRYKYLIFYNIYSMPMLHASFTAIWYCCVYFELFLAHCKAWPLSIWREYILVAKSFGYLDCILNFCLEYIATCFFTINHHPNTCCSPPFFHSYVQSE